MQQARRKFPSNDAGIGAKGSRNYPGRAERFPLFQRRSVADELSSTYITFLPFNPGFRRRRLLLLVRKRREGEVGAHSWPRRKHIHKTGEAKPLYITSGCLPPSLPPCRGEGWPSNIVVRASTSNLLALSREKRPLPITNYAQ